MDQLIIYLTFDGNCREAMSFYQNCLGGILIFETLGETPGSGDLPEAMKNYIVNATLNNDRILLIGTDMCEGKLISGNAVSILIRDENPLALKRIYNKLKIEAESTSPIAETFWGGLFWRTYR